MKILAQNHYRMLLHKSIACFLIFSMLFILPVQVVRATPTNPDIVVGDAGVTQTGNTTNVDILSSRTVINWDSLDTNASEILQYLHDGGSFAVLNRVMQGDATQFNGSLLANQGTIIIVNPKGIVFGPTSLIQAANFTASSLDISNTDFMNGDYNFSGDGVGQVANYGNISAEKVALIGKKVLNAGTISSPGGYTIMAAGDAVYLGSEGSDVVVEVAGVTVPDGTVDGIGDVINEGTIDATDGMIIMAAGDTYVRAVEGLDTLTVGVESGIGRVGQFGTLIADGSDGDSGSITMTAADMVVIGDDSVTTANAGANGDGGEIIAYSPDTTLSSTNAVIEAKGGSLSGDGGFVEISGKEYVAIGGVVDTTASTGNTGTFLIDPTNIKIGSGYDGYTNLEWDGFEYYQADSTYQSYLDASILESQLALSNVIVSTDEGSASAEGWIWVAAAVSWATGNSLTLNANGHITISAEINNTGNGEFNAFTNGAIKAGDINVNANVTAGKVVMQAGDPTIDTDTQSDINIADGVTVTATSDNVDLSAREHINIDGNVIAKQGDISIAADRDLRGRGNVDASGNIDAEQGSVAITGRDVTVNTVHAFDDIELTGLQNAGLLAGKDYEGGGVVDAQGLISTDNGDIDIMVKATPESLDEEFGELIYSESDEYDPDGLILVGDNINAKGNVTLHNNTEFYAEDDQDVTAANGSIEAKGTLTKTSETDNLYLHAKGDVSLAGNVINEADGVSIISETGKIFTPGSNALNVTIKGYSDDFWGQGVDLPYEEDGKAAIVLVSHDTLELGPDGALIATGWYGDSGDNRPGGELLAEDGAIIGGYERDEGIPSDIAIYARSTTGNVIINNPYAIIVDNFLAGNEEDYNATVVLDAYDSVLIPFLQTLSSAELQSLIDMIGDDTAGFRLEVVSRITEWLSQAINNGTLPFADNPEIMEALLGQDYVLRGAGQANPEIAAEENSNRAWVLEDPLENVPAPLAVLEIPELKGCPVEMDAAASELAINSDQLQLLIGASLAANPNLQPCEACQKLVTAANILNDADGAKLAAMNQIFNTLAPADAPFTPEIQANIATAFAGMTEDDPLYAAKMATEEFINAFVNYVAVVGTDLQVPVGDPVAFALEKHGEAISTADNPNIAAYIMAQMQ